MTTPLLAAVLEGEVVVLDPHLARVILLDPRSERIWRACTGVTEEEISAAAGEPSVTVTGVLRELREAGLITADQGRWRRARVTWV